jgi:hypothetical protein
MKISLFFIMTFTVACSTIEDNNGANSTTRIPSNVSSNCNSLTKNFFSFLFSDEKMSQGPEIKTKVRLSGSQHIQERSILGNLRSVQQLVNDANKLVLNKNRPLEILVFFDERKTIRMSSINCYEMALANIGIEEAEMNKSIILHEYFHLVLNKAISKGSQDFDKFLESELVRVKNIRLIKKYYSLQRESLSIEFNLSAIRSIKSKLLHNKNKAEALGETFSASLEYRRAIFKELKREDIIEKYKEVNAENIDALFDELEPVYKKLEIQFSKVKKIKENLSYDENFISKSEKDFNLKPTITTLWASGIRELFADLGSVLTLENPSALKESLNASLRDFSQLKTLNECDKEFQQLFPDIYSSVNSEHSLFAYLRGVLWNNYFVKIPQGQRNEKWPLMMNKLANSFADEIINPTYERSFISFASANIHLENIIQNSLVEFLP